MAKTYSYSRDGNTALSPHFQVHEFASINGTKLYSDTVLVDDALVALLERLYTAAGKFGTVLAIYVNSGYRTPAHDKAVGGSGCGQHVLGKAADIIIKVKAAGADTIQTGSYYFLSGKRICCILKDLGCLGIGYIGGRAVHCDTRTVRWWGDESTGKNNVTDWYSYFAIKKPATVTPAAPVKVTAPAKPATAVSAAFKPGDTVKIKPGVKTYASGTGMASFIRNAKKLYVRQVGSGKVLVSLFRIGLSSGWVRISDIVMA